MREYETIYLTKPDITSEAGAKLKEKLQGALEKFGAKTLHQVDWGKRKLAYEVKKEKFGRYFYLSYLSEGNVTAELERLLKYDDSVLKFISVQVADEVDAEARLKNPGTPPSPPEEPASRYASDSASSSESSGRSFANRDYRAPREDRNLSANSDTGEEAYGEDENADS
ncbi:MAG: 30S ribosomal protein S6 [Deltaproteobacteria bacterium]|nr:30S ribosomal protein S6 [Deltaproteobacteria bacterium]